MSCCPLIRWRIHRNAAESVDLMLSRLSRSAPPHAATAAAAATEPSLLGSSVLLGGAAAALSPAALQGGQLSQQPNTELRRYDGAGRMVVAYETPAAAERALMASASVTSSRPKAGRRRQRQADGAGRRVSDRGVDGVWLSDLLQYAVFSAAHVHAELAAAE